MRGAAAILRLTEALRCAQSYLARVQLGHEVDVQPCLEAIAQALQKTSEMRVEAERAESERRKAGA